MPLQAPRPRQLPALRARTLAPLSAALLLTLTACGSSGDDTANASPTASSSTTASSAAPSGSASGRAATSGSQATPGIVSAANAFLSALTSAHKDAVLFDRDDTEQKQRWSNLPTGLYERQGLKTGDMSEAELNAGLAVLESLLSDEGYQRVVAEWTADDQLAGSGGGGGPGGQLNYGRQYYYFAVIGEPSATEPWQFQFGGHHVTVNATVHGDDLSLTPSFIGAQPATYENGSTTVRPLGDISDEAFALVNSLDSSEKSKAVLGDSYIDLVAGPGQDCKTIQTEGLKGSEMTAAQQKAFLQLINEYAGLANTEDATARQAQLTTDLPSTAFAWYGPTATGSASYFRVTGPHVVIEFSPQSMGGDATDHIHGMYRDPTNDYGGTVCS